MRALAPNGRWVVVGFTGGPVPSIPLNRVLLRNIDVVGSYIGGYLGQEAGGRQRLNARLLELVAQDADPTAYRNDACIGGRTRSAARDRRPRSNWQSRPDSGVEPHSKREVSVRHSTERILVSHAGNLPRPEDVNRLVADHDAAGFRQSAAERGPGGRRPSDRAAAWTSSTTANTSRPAASPATSRTASPAGRYLPVDPAAAQARGRRRARPARLPRLLRLRPVVVRFRRTDPARLRHARPGRGPTHDRARSAPAPSKYTAQDMIKQDVAHPQGRPRRQERARASSPRSVRSASAPAPHNAYYPTEEAYMRPSRKPSARSTGPSPTPG